ncbi:MAG: SDR family oxidoreductase [Bacteroidota bacterium]
MNSSLHVLVLGSEGFIGSHAVKYFLSKNYKVTGADLLPATSLPVSYFSLVDEKNSYRSIFSNHQFDVCINAAGSGNVGLSMIKPLFDFESNTLQVLQVLDAIRLFQPACKFILISSAAVYGNPLSLPVNEDHQVQPLSPYGWHKCMAENICREFTQLYHIGTAITRPFSVYGSGLRKQLFWDMYQKYKSCNGTIELWGTGNESRDFIYISDLCYCFDVIINQSPFQADVYNIASGIETTVKQAATLLFKELDSNVSIGFNKKINEGNPLNWKADISAIQKLGFQSSIIFEEGIKKLSEWLRNQN